MKPHLYLQIASKLRTTILRGDYVLGQKIPSIRSLAENEKCNPATIQKAMKVLEEQNLVISCGIFCHSKRARNKGVKISRIEQASENFV